MSQTTANLEKDNKYQKKISNKLLDQDDIHIGVIGSGLAGLSAALSVLRAFRQKHFLNIDNNAYQTLKKIKITIYERDASQTDRKEGYGMTITYNPDGPLAKLDLLEEVAKRDCPSRCHYLFDSEGFVRGYFGNEFYDLGDKRSGSVDSEGRRDITADTTSVANEAREIIRGSGQRGNIRIPRSELRNILFEALMKEAREIASKYADSQRTDAPIDVDGSSICSIQWNRKLVSYVDRPMQSKMNSIFRKDCAESIETQRSQGQQKLQKAVERPVLLNFDDGSSDQVDLLVGADGVNSVVSRQYLSTIFPSHCSKRQSLFEIMQKSTGNEYTGPKNLFNSTVTKSLATDATENLRFPQYLGIFLILGITNAVHPHLDERGFYTLDGEKRLFVMPFKGSKLEDARHAADEANLHDSIADNKSFAKHNSNNCNSLIPKRRKTMWQLSFPVRDFDEAMRLKNLPEEELKREVLRMCGHWHEPFPKMVHETPLDTIWGTGLLDRDPHIFIQHRQAIEIHGRLPSHVVIIGDAAHSMSPFKGQGANQSLADGPLLASWLVKSKLDSAIRGFMAEMARRSGVKVRASRESATMLHSENCWDWMEQSGYNGFHGVEDKNVPLLFDTLKERGVNASLGAGLDGAIRKIIFELGIATSVSRSTSPNKVMSAQEMDCLQSNALEYASTGNTFELRLLSRISNMIIPNAKDSTQRTCLHLAAANGHTDTCRWLLSEVSASCHSLDNENKTALDLAMEKQHNNAAAVLKSWMAYSSETTKNDISISSRSNGRKDAYRIVEQQFRGIRTVKQLCTMLKNNRNSQKTDPSSDSKIQHVNGCPIDHEDHERDRREIQLLAQQHGAVLLRNYVAREADQIALGALALRPLNFNYSEFSGYFDSGCKGSIGVGNGEPLDKKAFKLIAKRMEKIKPLISISADSSAVVQTNFASQSAAYGQLSSPESKSSNSSSSKSSGNLSKKRKVDSFPLSKLRYLNLGEWNYNWGDRKYEKVLNAMPLPQRIISLARHADSIAACRMNRINSSPVPFDMAICNLYHLQRPSDRLGGHKDNVESNLSLPLVTVSLGAPGIFLLGGESREDEPTAILLRAGDCMVLSSKSRGYFHGVPTILEPYGLDDCILSDAHNEPHRTIFPEVFCDDNREIDSDCEIGVGTDELPTEDELAFVKAFLSTVRMNLSIRQV